MRVTSEQQGPAWAKGIKDEVLNAELMRRKAWREGELLKRKALAMEARNAHLAIVYPTYNRDTWLTIANFLVAFIVAGLALSPIARYVGPHVGAYYELIASGLLVCAFLALFSPGIYFILKEKRVHRSFREEHPEHAEALVRS